MGGPYLVEGGRIQTDGFEVVATHHCNLRCRACAYLAPVQRVASAEPATVERDLTLLASAYHASEARILGGEPLLHPDLPDLLRSVRRSGICDTIRVITNGRKLPVMASAFWELVDEVSISSYPGEELSVDELATVEAVAARHDVRIKCKEFRFFRESYSEIASADDELVEHIYRTCQMAHVWRCHTYWNGRLYRCPQSLFLPLVLHGSIKAIEGLPLQPDPGLLNRLLEFLEAPAPLASCRHCLGSVGIIIPHRQGRRSTWRDTQRLPVTELLDQAHLALLLAEPGLLVRDTSYLEPS